MRPAVLYALPSGDQMYVDTHMAAMALLRHTILNDVQLAFANVKGANLPTQRNELVNVAHKLGATHIFWTATDMTYPPDALLRLLAHDKGMVAAGYRQRYRDGRVLIEIERGTPLTAADVTIIEGVKQVAFTALDCAVIHLDLMGAKRPFTFEHERTEDYVFCDALTDAGESIYVDFDLTKQVSHLGQHAFRAHVDPRAL